MLWELSGLALLVEAYIKYSCLVAVSCQAIIYRIKPTAFQTLRQRKKLTFAKSSGLKKPVSYGCILPTHLKEVCTSDV